MGLEDLGGFDQGEGMDAASFEKFQERMRKAAAQIKAIRKQEKKQKKKENELIKILLKFIKHSHKKDLVLLISRVLEKNMPANFVLAVVLLGNEEIQQEIGKYLLPEEIRTGEVDLNQLEAAQAQDTAAAEKALIFFGDDKSLPLKIRIEIDNWIKGLILQASESAPKLLKTAYDIKKIREKKEGAVFENEVETRLEKTTSDALIKLTANIILDFLKQNGLEEDFEKLQEFSKFLLKGILDKTKEELDDRLELGG
ncbi:hypothetical protein HOE67_03380 [Candidatus Peregrinibacteria bacterium]|jgi:hypothetical protein|nr:hypothetical protein [Candidatus Peregrinibacteria bacterium]MBT4056127.1 hypothetical protein [Candidatus Peregrinibacteria bacterium]